MLMLRFDLESAKENVQLFVFVACLILTITFLLGSYFL